MYMQAQTCACIHTPTHTHTHTHAHTHTHTHTHTQSVSTRHAFYYAECTDAYTEQCAYAWICMLCLCAGVFVGHCVLEYKRLTFSQLVRVHTNLQTDLQQATDIILHASVSNELSSIVSQYSSSHIQFMFVPTYQPLTHRNFICTCACTCMLSLWSHNYSWFN